MIIWKNINIIPLISLPDGFSHLSTTDFWEWFGPVLLGCTTFVLEDNLSAVFFDGFFSRIRGRSVYSNRKKEPFSEGWHCCWVFILIYTIYIHIYIYIYILDSTAYTCVPIIDPNLDICRLYCRLFILKFHMTVTYYKFKIWSVIELSGRSILQFLVRNLSCCHKTITVHFLWVPALCQAYYISRGGLDTEWKPMVFGIEAPLRKKRFGGSKLDARYCNGQGLMKALWLLKS